MIQRFRLQDFGPLAPLPAVLAYLSRHGWQTRQDGQVIRCEGPPDDEGQPILHFLPASETYADYPLRLEGLVVGLAAIEERPAVEIIREMAEPPPSSAGAGVSLAESILAEFQHSASGVFSPEEVRRLAGQLTPALMILERETAGMMNVEMRLALFIARLGQDLPDNAGSQRVFDLICRRLLVQAGAPPTRLPPDYAELFRLSRDTGSAAPEEVLTWLESRLPRGLQARQKGRTSE